MSEEGEALAEACEERGALAVLTLLGAAEQKAIRRPGLKALARLASDNHPTLLEIGGRPPQCLGEIDEIEMKNERFLAQP